jgi:glutathione S-transferase
MEFGSALLNVIGRFYNATDETALIARATEIRTRLTQVEVALGEGPHFTGESFSMVDAVFGPVFRYFDVFDAIGEFGFWDGLPKVQRWRQALAARPSVAEAVRPDDPELLLRFLWARGTALSRRMTPAAALV